MLDYQEHDITDRSLKVSITGHTPDCTSPRHANSTSKRSYICKQVEEMHYSSQTGESWCHSACFRGRRPRTKSRPAGVTTRLGLHVQRVARAAAHPKPAGYSCPSTPAAPLHLGTAVHQDRGRAATPQAAQGTPRHAGRRISRAPPADGAAVGGTAAANWQRRRPASWACTQNKNRNEIKPLRPCLCQP